MHCLRPITMTIESLRRLNIEYAKAVACVLVVVFTCYHGALHALYGNDSCKWLLTDGRFSEYKTWQPYGCMVHKYTIAQARTCIKYNSNLGKHNHIVFIGDSRMRYLYFEFINLISKKKQRSYIAHWALTFVEKTIDIKVEFIWDPTLNKSMVDYQNWSTKTYQSSKSLVVVGCATWIIKKSNGSAEGLASYENKLNMFTSKINTYGSTTILWKLNEPVVEEKLSRERKMITNKQIDKYNNVARHLINGHSDIGLHIWSSARLIAAGLPHESTDGLHFGKTVQELHVQMLFNMYCNNQMNYNDGTCCNSSEPVFVPQIIAVALFGTFMVLSIFTAVFLRSRKRKSASEVTESNKKEELTTSEKLHEICTTMSKFGLIMAYFYLCDRTDFFMKENKYYTNVDFLLPVSYMLVIGLFFTDVSSQTSFLHRDQSDEWKGWMQLLILIYHYTGASKIVPIYMFVRVLVSSYLFLSGYGHFTYYWRFGDYGGIRLCKILFRMNVLVLTLCIVMHRPYQFYYFVPLITFWFLVLYITMAMWPHVTMKSTEGSLLSYWWMIIKFAILITLIILLVVIEPLFHVIFIPRSLYVLGDNTIQEWRFRWKLDHFSSIYGMLFAFFYQFFIKRKFTDDSSDKNLFSNRVTLIVCLLAVLGITSYVIFSFNCGSKPWCNSFHPYFTVVPIVSFLLLRNVPGWIRVRYSPFFAWFGKISLELFICQYHVWLAADTHGVLVLIPGYPVINVIVLSFIFVCLCHEVSKISNVLLSYAVPNSWKGLLRNLVIFIAFIIPVHLTFGQVAYLPTY